MGLLSQAAITCRHVSLEITHRLLSYMHMISVDPEYTTVS